MATGKKNEIHGGPQLTAALLVHHQCLNGKSHVYILKRQ